MPLINFYGHTRPIHAGWIDTISGRPKRVLGKDLYKQSKDVFGLALVPLKLEDGIDGIPRMISKYCVFYKYGCRPRGFQAERRSEKFSR